MDSSGVQARALKTRESDTSSDDPWERMKKQGAKTGQGKAKARRQQTPQQQFLSGVASMARASAKISLSMPGVAASSMPLAGLATEMDSEQTQQQQQQQQQKQQQKGETESEGKAEPIEKHTRARRGTAGTFKGRRPPKDAAKLKLFLAQKEVYQKEQQAEQQRRREELRKNKKKPTELQIRYRAFLRAQLQSDNSPGAFANAIEDYRQLFETPRVRKKPAARGRPDAQVTPVKKKSNNDEVTETPDKIPAPSEAASSSTDKQHGRSGVPRGAVQKKND